MTGLGRILVDLFTALGVHVPAWAVPLILVGIFAAAMPWYRKGHRRKVARRWLVRASQARREDRLAMEARAQEMVADDPEGRLMLAHEAWNRGRGDLATALLDGLPGASARRLREEVEKARR